MQLSGQQLASAEGAVAGSAVGGTPLSRPSRMLKLASLAHATAAVAGASRRADATSDSEMAVDVEADEAFTMAPTCA